MGGNLRARGAVRGIVWPAGHADMNRILFADDCLDVLRDEVALPGQSVDLIYLDPPFNSNSRYNLPFRGKYKTGRPVEAFHDTWHWGEEEEAALSAFADGPSTRFLADIIRVAQHTDPARGQRESSLAAYLANMAARLIPMRRVLKSTGTIVLHCDPAADAYLRILLSAIFGGRSYRNEIVWSYGGRGAKAIARQFPGNHDVLLVYGAGEKAASYNQQFRNEVHPLDDLPSHIRLDEEGNPFKTSPRGDYTDQSIAELEKQGRIHRTKNGNIRIKYYLERDDNNVFEQKMIGDVWDDIPDMMHTPREERLGYPTQKPVRLLERVIAAFSNAGDLVLDPFCGCGTTLHAAEKLGRRWIGVDISTFATGLIRERILSNFPNLDHDLIEVRGVPETIADARALADRDKFEFEKWTCGAIGAHGMFREPGEKGADGGVDGVLEFYPFRLGEAPRKQYAIIQVKGGRVTPDACRALYATVKRFNATAGVMVCFPEYMSTVENNRNIDTFTDDAGTYPVIQGHSIEDLLQGKPLNLPTHRLRSGARVTQPDLLDDATEG